MMNATISMLKFHLKYFSIPADHPNKITEGSYDTETREHIISAAMDLLVK